MNKNTCMDFGGRKEVFMALVGSHNYNLNTLESDKDYKIFVMPSFEDLYFGNSFCKSYIGEIADYDVHDIRKCSSLWYKANVNFLEVLFSEDLKVNTNLSSNTQLLVRELYDMKHDIAKMNLRYLYDACIGMHYNKMKCLEKGTAGTQYLVDQFNFDTKQGLHAIRILDFLKRFADNNFTDFKAAIWYGDNNPGKELLLNVKTGHFSLTEYKSMAVKTLHELESNYKQLYKAQSLDETTNNRIAEIIKMIVKENIN